MIIKFVITMQRSFHIFILPYVLYYFIYYNFVINKQQNRMLKADEVEKLI